MSAQISEAPVSSACFVIMMRKYWKCLLDEQKLFFFLVVILQNYFLSLQSKTAFFDWKGVTESTFGDDRKAELMQSEAHFYPDSPRNIQYYSFLLSAQSFNHLSPTVGKSHVTPKKTQLMSIKIEKGVHMGAKHNQMEDMPTHEKLQRSGACMNYWWGAHGALGSGVVFTKVNRPWVMSSTGTVAHLKMIKLPPHQLQTINL